jgi:hypothetical protein
LSGVETALESKVIRSALQQARTPTFANDSARLLSKDGLSCSAVADAVPSAAVPSAAIDQSRVPLESVLLRHPEIAWVFNLAGPKTTCHESCTINQDLALHLTY